MNSIIKLFSSFTFIHHSALIVITKPYTSNCVVFRNPWGMEKGSINSTVSRLWVDPDSSHYYHIKLGYLFPGKLFCEMFLSDSLVGQHKQRTDSSFLVIRVLIWTPFSFQFICKATLLPLGPQMQTGALSGSPGYILSTLCHVDPPRSWWVLRSVLEQHSCPPTSCLPLNKPVSLGLSSWVQNGRCCWARWSSQSQHINHRIMPGMLMNQLLQINKLRSFWDLQYWFSHSHLLQIVRCFSVLRNIVKPRRCRKLPSDNNLSFD